MDEWGNSAIFQIIKVMVPILAIIDAIAFLQDRWDGIKKAFTEGGFIEGIKAIGATIDVYKRQGYSQCRRGSTSP